MSPTEYEQLVEFLGRRFTDIDQRFEQIDQRFGQIDQRFDLVAHRFDAIDHRFDQVEGQIAELRREILGHFDEPGRGENIETSHNAEAIQYRSLNRRM